MKKRFIMPLITLLASCVGGGEKWDATGVFESTEVVVSAQGNGTLNIFEVTEGDTINSGQMVGYIDTVQLELKRQQLVASRSGVKSRSQDIGKQIAATEQQIVWQESELKRFETLLSQNASTQKQVDDLANQIQVLNRQLAAQRSTLEKGNRTISDDGSALEIQIKQVEDQLQKCHISSPINGTVLIKYAEQGEFTATGKPLFSVADMKNMHLRAYITADLLTQMKLGQRVLIYSDFEQDGSREYQGVVEWIAEKAEFTPKNIQTRDERANLVYAVKIAVKNDGLLKIGMYGQMKLIK